jgi:hypothetical protein
MVIRQLNVFNFEVQNQEFLHLDSSVMGSLNFECKRT